MAVWQPPVLVVVPVEADIGDNEERRHKMPTAAMSTEMMEDKFVFIGLFLQKKWWVAQ